MNSIVFTLLNLIFISYLSSIDCLPRAKKYLKEKNQRRQTSYTSVKQSSSGGGINQEVKTGGSTIGGASLQSDGNSPSKSLKVTNKVLTFGNTTDKYYKHNIPPQTAKDSATKTGSKSKSDSFSGSSSGLAMKNLQLMGSFAKEDKSVAFSMGYGGGGGIAIGNNSTAGGAGGGIGWGIGKNAKNPRKKVPQKTTKHL